MATFNRFDCFTQDVGRGVHNLHADTLKVLLTNTAPSASNSVKADVTEISAGNGYTAGGYTLANKTFAQTAGVAKLLADDVTVAASGGTMGTWRYAVLYNDTPTSPLKPLIGWWDYGSAVSLASGQSRVIDFPSTRLVLGLP